MKIIFDRALWPVAEKYSSVKECEVDYSADDIDSEVSRVLSWVETELKDAIDSYNSLQKIINSST